MSALSIQPRRFTRPNWRIQEMQPISCWKFGGWIMQAYEAGRFDPPAPVAFVTVRSEQLGIEIHNVPMLLDTGADVSLLPRSHAGQLVSPDAKQYELEAFDGTKSTAPAVNVELQFVGKSFRGQFLLIDSWHGVLGRNVLNNLSLLLDGPSRKWMERPY